MDAAELTRLLAEAHPEGVTWDTHLAFVERLAEWEPEALRRLAEDLIGHMIEGSWTGTFGNLSITTPHGTIISAISQEQQTELMRGVAESPWLSEEQSQRFREEYEYLRDLTPPVPVRLDPGPGILGIPITDWWGEESVRGLLRSAKGSPRRRALAIANSDRAVHYQQVRWTLRAPAWALRRVTGERLREFRADWEEDLHDTGGVKPFVLARVLRRDSEAIEVLTLMNAPSTDYVVDHVPSLAALARRLAAQVDRRPVVIGEDRQVRPHVPGFPEGLIDEWPTTGENANSLLMDARALLSGGERRRETQPLEADKFWALIDLLHGDANRMPELVDALAVNGATEILAFSEALADALHLLDRPEFLNDPGDPAQIPMSEDVFLYFRCSVVVSGRSALERVLSEGVLREAEWDDGGAGELLLGAAAEAFERATGRELDYETFVSYETGSNRDAWGERLPPQGRTSPARSAVRTRASTAKGEVDSVYLWNSDRSEATAAQVAAERSRAGRTEVWPIDDLVVSPDLPASIAAARVHWVRVLLTD